MKLKALTVGIALLAIGSLSHAQEESFPCRGANPALKDLFQGKTLKSLYVHACSGNGLHQMASSFLKPGGQAPKIMENGDEPPNDAAYVAWTCKYAPGNLLDGDTNTAWVEGADGYGIGEVVLFPPCIELTKAVEIWSGYGKSASVFASNSRPKKVRVVIIQAQYGGGTQYGTSYSNLSVVAKSEVVLEDVNAYQKLDIPAFKVTNYYSEVQEQNVEHTYLLGLEILDVYKGTKYADTCISEIRNR